MHVWLYNIIGKTYHLCCCFLFWHLIRYIPIVRQSLLPPPPIHARALALCQSYMYLSYFFSSNRGGKSSANRACFGALFWNKTGILVLFIRQTTEGKVPWGPFPDKIGWFPRTSLDTNLMCFDEIHPSLRCRWWCEFAVHLAKDPFCCHCYCHCFLHNRLPLLLRCYLLWVRSAKSEMGK